MQKYQLVILYQPANTFAYIKYLVGYKTTFGLKHTYSLKLSLRESNFA